MTGKSLGSYVSPDEYKLMRYGAAMDSFIMSSGRDPAIRDQSEEVQAFWEEFAKSVRSEVE